MPHARYRSAAKLITAALLLAVQGCAHHTAVPAPPESSASPQQCIAVPSVANDGTIANAPVDQPAVTFDSAWSIIARSHWDSTYNGVDWRGVRDELRPRASAARTNGELRAVLGEMVGRLRQSHFSIIPREQSEGVSAPGSAARTDEHGTAGLTVRLIDGSLVVTRLDPDGSAFRQGVRAGWALEAAGGCALAPRLARIAPTTDARRAGLLAYGIGLAATSGAAGDTAQLVFRDGKNRRQLRAVTLAPERGSLQKFGNLPPFPAHLEFERVAVGSRTVGVIHFNIWMPVLARQFDVAMDSLRSADAIVLDLRGNFGGIGGMSMGFAGHFLDSAVTIGTMHQRTGAINFVANPRRVDTGAKPISPYAGPLALVIDELSISTTEIFAAGLQTLHRARVFGSQSAGQALPAVSERLPNGDFLYHAIADFTSPSGAPVEGAGVVPDQKVRLTRNALLGGADPALDAAIAWGARRAAAIDNAKGQKVTR